MRQIFSTNKGVDILDIPRPIVDRGYLLVQTYYSFISTGTELRAINDVENKNGNKRFKNNLNVNITKTLKKLS